MLTIALCVLFFLLYFTGIGLLLPFRLLRPTHFFNDLLASFWLGLAAAVAFLQLWHFLFPVTLLTWGLLLGLSLLGWGLNARAVWGWLRAHRLRRILTLLALLAPALLILSNQAIWGEVHFDHGLYHMQTVKWIENFAIVPGLGNLHHRFAFNNSSMLYAALLNPGPFHGLAFYTASTLTIFAVLLRCFSALARLVEERGALRPTDLFYALFTPFLLWYTANSTFTGYSPDIFIFALQSVLAGGLIAIFTRDPADTALLRTYITRVVLLAALAITVKLSSAVFAAGVLLAAVVYYLLRTPRFSGKWRALAGWAGSGALLILPWLARSVILSGYLLYPSPLISFNVPWKIPVQMVEPIAPIIRLWATYGSGSIPNISFWEWLATWSKKVPFEIKEGVFYLIGLLALTLLLRLASRRPQRQSGAPLVVLAICIASLVYWGYMAPDVRFMGAAFWLAVTAALMLFIQQVMAMKAVKSLNLLTAAVMLVVLFWLSPNFTNQISRSYLISPPLETFIAEQSVTEGPQPYQVTRSGLVVYTPKDYSKEACWDAPLPCTRLNDYDSRLSLLDPQDMQKGFYIKIP